MNRLQRVICAAIAAEVMVCTAGCGAMAMRNQRLAMAAHERELAAAGQVQTPLGPAATDAATMHAAGRAGSNLAQQAGSPGSGNAADPEAMLAVARQLQEMGSISPEDQQRLLADLKATDPALWPQLIRYFQIALARQRQQTSGGDAQTVAALPPGPVLVSGLSDPQQNVAVAAASTADRAGGQHLSPAQMMAQATAQPPATAPTAVPQDIAAATIQSPSAAPTERPLSADPAAMVNAAPRDLPPTEVAAAVPAATETPAQAPASAGQVQQVSFEQPVAADWRMQLAGTIKALEQPQATVGGQPVSDATRQATLRILYLLDGRTDDALKKTDGLSEVEQAFWADELFGLKAWLDENQTDPSRRAAAAAKHLDQASAKLGELGSLTVRNIAFCTEVRSYGITKNFEVYEFAPGQEVLLYAELDGFKSEETPQGFHTAFKSSYEVFDSQGRRIAQQEFPLTEEHCRNRRRDFFIRYYLQMPSQQVYDGKHTLRLTIEDTLGQKIGQASLDFIIKNKPA